jgi:hypothetical protein
LVVKEVDKGILFRNLSEKYMKVAARGGEKTKM